MAKRGRPSRAGKRERNGRLKRNSYPTPSYDKGSERVQAMRDKFGEHYSSALGRAYAAGLLGEESEARIRLDAGKRFSRLYSAIIEQGRYRCPLNPDPRSSGRSTAFHGAFDSRDDHDWLFEAMNELDRAGLRGWLDQMLSLEFVDAGPVWLTRLLMGGGDPYDRAMLTRAIDALDIIAPVTRPSRIVAVSA